MTLHAPLLQPELHEPQAGPWLQITPHLFRYVSTCHVYAFCQGSDAVLIDFGDGSVLEHLPTIGVHRVTDVLMTHHHRDQGQGLARAATAGARVWVPYVEQDLFRDADGFWQSRPMENDYTSRQDRFSLLESVQVYGTLRDYDTLVCSGHGFEVIPTPGHTVGSVSLLAEIDDQRVVFTGDLIAAPGKVWSLAATQWTYNGAEGAAASLASLLDLRDRDPDLLLPSHGEPMNDPAGAIDLLAARLRSLLDERRENLRFYNLRNRPYEAVTPHLLFNRTSMANSYVLLSESGKALLIDFGYDFMTGFTNGSDRASRRPWLYTLPDLKNTWGVRQVEAVIPTHYHEDHVAGCNLLRSVEGTQVWAAENFADILEHPQRYDLSCLWYDPIPVDRRLPLSQPFQWEEYVITLHPLPGHTRYAVAVAFEVDGQRVLAVGDQYEQRLKPNYVYRNGFSGGDYRESAALIQRLRPDWILPGHQDPFEVQPETLQEIEQLGAAVEQLHSDLLLPEALDAAGEEINAHLLPYQATTPGGEPLEYTVEFTNPHPWPAEVVLRLVTPEDWKVQARAGSGTTARLSLEGCQPGKARFQVTPVAKPVRRARLAVDLTLNGQRLGQLAEALLTITGSLIQPAPATVRSGWAPLPVTVIQNPVLDDDFPDPSLLQVGHAYYAFATNSKGVHVQVARSEDLTHWQRLPDALPVLPEWAVQHFGFTWSPAVAPARGQGYVMYYVTRARNAKGGQQAIGLATAERPEGPFHPVGSGPFLRQKNEGGSIDPSVFLENGWNGDERYLLWKNDGNSCRMRTWIYLQRLSEDGLSLVGEPQRLLTADQPWEGYLVEAPSLWKHDDLYYLFYSANDFGTNRYAIGWAVARSLWGPYRKSKQPLLGSHSYSRLIGPGGQDILQTPDGETWMMFHAWSAGSPAGSRSEARGKYRNLNLARLVFENDEPRLVFEQPTEDPLAQARRG